MKSAETILIRPHLTEKAALGESLARPVYTFVVASRATKKTIAAAMKTLYQVTPVKVTVARVKGKNFTYRGRPGRTADFKKAQVYLPAGSKINLL